MVMNKRKEGHVSSNGDRKGAQGVWLGGALSGREYLKDPGLDVKILLHWVFRKWSGGVDCIDLAQERLRAFVNTVTNHWVS